METKSNIPYVLFLALFTLSVTNLLHIGTDRFLREIGHHTINLTFAILFLTFIYLLISKRSFGDLQKLWMVLALFGLYALIYIISYNMNVETAKFDYLIRLMFAFLAIFTMMLIKWDKQATILFGYVLLLVLIFLFIDWMNHDFTLSRFQGVHFANINGLGVTLFCFSYFLILAIRYSHGAHRLLFLAGLALNFILLFSTSSRTPMLALVFILLATLFIKYFQSYRLLFILTICCSTLLVPFYIWFENTKLSTILNDWSIKIFDKSLYSGREDIWGPLLEVAMESPIIGHGIGIHGREFVGLSAHNQYIQILLEVGIVGLIVFLVLLYFIFDVLVKNKKTFAARLSIVYLCGILIYEVFELTLFQNNYSISILQWLIITAGIFFIDENAEVDRSTPVLQRVRA